MATYTLMLLTSLFFAALIGYRLYHTRERSYARRMRREARAYARPVPATQEPPHE